MRNLYLLLSRTVETNICDAQTRQALFCTCVVMLNSSGLGRRDVWTVSNVDSERGKGGWRASDQHIAAFKHDGLAADLG